MVNGTLALAASIAAMDRDELSELVTARRILSPSTVGDPLALSLELLRPDSISRALRTAHRDELGVLLEFSRSGEPDPVRLQQLVRLGLVGVDEEAGRLVPLPEVVEALSGLVLPPAPEAQTSSHEVDTASWFGQALTSVRRAAELLRGLAAAPVRLGRKGTLTLVSLRELAQRKNIDAQVIEHLLTGMEVAGLLTRVQGHGTAQLLVPSHRAQSWLALDYPHRWLALAQTAIDDLDDRARRDLEAAGCSLTTLVAHTPLNYPLLPEGELNRLERLADFCEELGLTVDGQLTEAAVELLHGRHDAAASIANRDFPPPVEGVYLQPDLSLIVPGPLSPENEAALCSIAQTEQLGVAASMRLSQTTLERAVRAGIPATRIRHVLERLSLTGVPQPLDFLLTELERLEPHVAAPPLEEWGSPPPPALDDTGDGASAALEKLVERVYAAAQHGDGDLSRRLELAIRHRSPVQVTAVAGTDKRVFTLLPVSLRDGRLRATDQKAGVERTLPVSAITAVEAA